MMQRFLFVVLDRLRSFVVCEQDRCVDQTTSTMSVSLAPALIAADVSCDTAMKKDGVEKKRSNEGIAEREGVGKYRETKPLALRGFFCRC